MLQTQYRYFSLLVLVIVLAGFGCRQYTDRKTALAPPSEAELFKSKCSQCHDAELALQQYRPEEVWYETITRMKEEHHADISRVEIEQLVKYHVERQKHDAAIFREKCEKCHPGKVFLEMNLTADQTRAIIRRMQQKSGNTIDDKDIAIIVRYHVQSHQAALEKNLRDILGAVQGVQPNMEKARNLERDMILFAENCSSCHELDRALTVIKDPALWAQTIKRMQHYSKGEITDLEAEKLVEFHVTEQRREITAFHENCMKCHDDKRINSRSMTDDQWLAIIKRMQQKAPELITDEKIHLLTAYFHRRELAVARIFYGKCHLCHYGKAGDAPFQNSSGQIGGVVVLGSEEFGENFQIGDVDSLLSFHVQRQKRDMRLYRDNCTTCHPDGLPKKNEPGEEQREKRNRAEWISFIAALQGLELNKEVQSTINSQIDYHISGY